MISKLKIARASILIVDDQHANIELLEELLAEEGYTNVASTMQPLEVLALHRKHHYDLILLDLQMPGKDGFEVLEDLKADSSDGCLPVLVITAQPAHKLRALKAGARDFISKPFDIIEVKTRIHNMIEVQLLYKKVENHSQELERVVQQRTAQLQESEERYRRLTELASDWYWEQDEKGNFSKISGPVLEMLGLEAASATNAGPEVGMGGWNLAERDILRARIAARQPFLDFVFSRTNADGSRQQFRVSGEPMFSRISRFIGYRGIGVEITVQR